MASYSYSLAADSQRVFLDEEIKLTGGSTETHEITYGYDNINRLTKETAESGDYGYDVYYEYDLVGNRILRQITVNSQPFTTEYEYYDGTDKLKTETQCGASCMLDIGDERYYAYAKQNGRGFYYRDSNGNKIGSFHAFMIGLPSVWSRYLFIFVMVMVPVLLFGTAVKRIILRILFCYGEPTRLRLRIPRESICVLLAFLIFIGPDGFESLAQAEMQYAELGTSSWGQADRTIEYTYDDNGSMLTKTTKVTSTQAVEETVTYDYNLANRLDKVTTELANGDQHIVEYTYNDEGIRVRAYSYDIPYGQGVQNEKNIIYLTDSYNHTGYAQTLEELVFDYADPNPLTETPDSLTTYLIGNDCLAQTVDGTTQYLLYNGHGSTRQLAEYDTSVSIAETFSYDGYGVLLQDKSIASQRPGYVSQQATSLLYAGEYFDSDSQHYYNRARWYNPLTGLFNRVDPFAGNLNDPQSLHKYLYAHCNPVNYTDPSGNSIQALTTNMIIAIAIASIAPAILSAYDAAKAGASWLEIGLNAALTWAVSFGIGIGLAIIAPLLISLATGIAGLFGISAIAAKVGLLILFASLTVYNMYKFWRTPQYPLSVKIAFTITLAVAIAVAIGKDGLTKIASKSKQFVKGLFSKQNTNSNPVISKAERLRLNRLKGNEYRNKIGDLMKKEGYDIKFERRYETTFGRRIIDIEVSKNGKILGGIETKTGSSPYTPEQQLKDAWLYRMKGYIVTVVHDM